MNPESTPYRTVTSSGEKETSAEAADNTPENQPQDLTERLGGVGITSAEHASNVIDQINDGKSIQVSIRRTAILDVLAHSSEPLTVLVIARTLQESSRNSSDSPHRHDRSVPTKPWEMDYSEKLIRNDLHELQGHGLVSAELHDNTRSLNYRYDTVRHADGRSSMGYSAPPAVVELFAPTDERQDEIPS